MGAIPLKRKYLQGRWVPRATPAGDGNSGTRRLKRPRQAQQHRTRTTLLIDTNGKRRWLREREEVA